MILESKSYFSLLILKILSILLTSSWTFYHPICAV